MKQTAFRLIALCLFILSYHVSFGQNVEENREVRAFLNSMFQDLDKTKVPHGLLKDYAFELAELENFPGDQINDQNYVDRPTYEMMLRTIRSAAVTSTKPFIDVNTIMANQYSAGGSNIIALSALAYQYSAIKEYALQDNLIRYVNDKVYDNTVNGVWQNPYETKNVIGVCTQDSVFKGTSFTLKLPSNCWFTNLSVRSIEVDPNGSGYRTITAGGSMAVSLSAGERTIKLRVTLTNGTQLLSHTRIKVESQVSTRAPVDLVVKTTQTGLAHRGKSTQAQVWVKTANSDGKIRKPFIVVEGFDPRFLGDRGGQGLTTAAKYYDAIVIAEGWRRPITGEYDFIYVDWVNAEEYMQSNSNTLQKVINWVNEQKITTSPNVIMGVSMGGVVTRHALKTMENAGINHQVSHYISCDAPHLGANVPLGALYAMYGAMSFLEDKNVIGFFLNVFTETGTSVSKMQKLVHSNAAQQMLFNYVDVSGNLNNTEYNNWQRELATLGFPRGDGTTDFRMLALANGNYLNPEVPASYLKANFSAQSDITDLLPGLFGAALGFALQDVWSGLLSLLPGRSTIKGHFQINPGKAAGVEITNMSLKYTKKLVWLANINRTVYSYKKNMPVGLMYDLFPSSKYSLEKPEVKGGGIKVIGSVDVGIDMAEDIPFIPTSSALCVGGGTQTLTASLFTNAPSINNTPFGGNFKTESYMPSEHTDISSAFFEWLVAQLKMGIDGPKLGNTGTKYTVTNPLSSSITWSTSNNSVATINQSGVLTAVGRGVVNIVARVGTTDITKEILVGTPRFVLQQPVRTPGFYSIKAECIETDAIKQFINGNKGIVYYEWGIKTDTDPLTWYKTDTQELLLSTLEETENTTIYLKIVDVHGAESSPVFVRISGYDIYTVGYSTLIFNSRGVAYNGQGQQLSWKNGTMPLTFRDSSFDEFSAARWNPMAGVVTNEQSIPWGIPWVRYGYLRDIIPQEEVDRILQFNNNQVAIFRLMLLNSQRKIIQKTPITIIYRPNFPN